MKKSFIAIVLAGFACVFAGLCYAELASMIPVAGSAYTYAYATMGELVAWIIGWDLVLEYSLSSSTVAVGWSAYGITLLREMGIDFPARLTAAPGTLIALPDGGSVPALFNLPAVLVCLAVTALLVRGIRESALPDFYIGAHAAVAGWPLLTRDASRYRSYFPKVHLIAPEP